MIGSVVIFGHSFRLTVGAMMRVERETGVDFPALLEQMEDRPSVTRVAHIIAAAMHNGQGGTVEEGAAFIDQHGFSDVMASLADLIGEAFATSEDAGKNGKTP